MEYRMTPVWSVFTETELDNTYGKDVRGNIMLFHAASGERIF